MDAGTLDCAATVGRDMWEGSSQPDAEYPDWVAAKQAGSRALRLPRQNQHAKDVGMSSDPGRAGPSEERTVSYQPEERYWTDYLRIALPVIGLLLLIGLLWYWASALIGDGSPAQQPTPEVAAIVTPINQATPAPPTPTAVVIAPTPGPPVVAATATVAAAAPPPTQPPAPATVAPTAVTENPCASLPVYEVGTLVMTTDQVNLRDAPTTESNIVTELPAGAQLQVTGPFSEAGQCDWWPVTATETGQAGFVIEQYLQPVNQ